MIQTAPLTEWRVVGLQAVDLMIQADTVGADILPGVICALDAGLNDYTITERGDVGSLVRTQAIQCVQSMWKSTQTQIDAESRHLLEGNIIRLSLEKMDRVRLQAARCLKQDLNAKSVSDVDVTNHRPFNWRVLLSLVQKAHYKSNNIPRILAAVEVYQALAEKPTARADTLKKLVSMLRTNPYPKVRTAVAECLFLATGDQALKIIDWNKPSQAYNVPIDVR
ncbi:hypothetical protein KCU86_g17782, partial [Aureobasidium melanogenum]